MFSVNGTEIKISKGDTGAILFSATVTRRDTGAPYTFGERDRALFCIKSGDQIVKKKSYQMNENKFIVVFYNADTDQLKDGGYSWDVRYVINPYYSDDPPEGPWPEYSELAFPIEEGTKCLYLGGCYIANQDIPTSENWTAAHWTAAWPNYADLSFPVIIGTRCMHEGTYYLSTQAIPSGENWNPDHWVCVDSRIPVDGDQVITPNQPMNMQILNVVSEI